MSLRLLFFFVITIIGGLYCNGKIQFLLKKFELIEKKAKQLQILFVTELFLTNIVLN